MKKPFKNDFIRIRINEVDKEKYNREAANYGMNLSEYIMHILRHKDIRVIEGGKEIAEAMYELNQTLNKCLNYPKIPTENIRKALEENVSRINGFMKGTSD